MFSNISINTDFNSGMNWSFDKVFFGLIHPPAHRLVFFQFTFIGKVFHSE